MTETPLAELLAADLSGLDLVALMIDGRSLRRVLLCCRPRGSTSTGPSTRWRWWRDSTENSTLVTGLVVNLRERGLDVTRPMLVGLDGSKALRKAVLDVLDRPVIQRCQLHKLRI